MASLPELLASLGDVPGNEHALRELAQQVCTEASVIPFVGAGLSAPFGYATWSDFLTRLAKESGTESAIRERLAAGQYEEAAEDLRRALGPRLFDDRVEEEFGEQRLAQRALSGAVTLVPAIAGRAIVTTNFDRVLERAFLAAGTTVRAVWGSEAAREGSRALQRDEAVLLKLHGDFSTSAGRILTLEEYRKHYGSTKPSEIEVNLPIPSLVFAMLATRSILFLGCSLGVDRTVNALLTVAARFPGSAHYALMAVSADEAEQRAKALQLSNMGVRPIWYPAGQHERIADVLAFLAEARRARVRARRDEREPEAAAPALGNVPSVPTALIGRATELQALARILDACRLVTIAGAPGIGKTRLALELARKERGRFADGVWFVELDSLREGSLVPQRIANVLGVREQSHEPPQESLRLHLANKSTLVLLDNAEHVVDSCARTAEFLVEQCPNLRIVVTSRVLLKAEGEYVYELWSLGSPPAEATRASELQHNDAVALLVERANARGASLRVTDDNAAAVANLCRALDGIPLAIQLAAARLRSSTVQEVSARLSEGLEVLSGPRSGPRRQWETLAAAMKWSYELLDPAQREFLRRLAVFDGGWVREAAGAIGGIDAHEATEMLDALRDHSLVVPIEHAGALRFRLLEPVRQYALERLQASGELEASQQRHAQWFLALVEQAEPKLLGAEAATWLDRLGVEADNLRAAIRWATSHGEADAALRLTGGLWRFCDIRGHLREGRERLAAALSMPGVEQFEAARGKAFSGAGMLAYRQGDYQAAQPLFEQALALEKRRGNQAGIANALNDLGIVAQRKGELARAKEMFEEGRGIESALGNGRGVGVALFNLGNVSFQMGELDSADKLLGESLRAFQAVGDERDAAFPLNVLGLVALRRREFDAAVRSATQSLTVRTRFGDKRGVAETQRTLALVRMEQGELDGAREALLESMKLATGVGDARGTAETLEFLGLHALRAGDAAHAVELVAAAAALRESSRIVALPFERGLVESALARAKSELGEERFRRRWDEGRAWPAADLAGLVGKLGR